MQSIKILFISLGLIAFTVKASSQLVNDHCETATIIPNVVSDMAFVYMTSTNLGGLSEDFNNSCQIGDFSTVWFRVTTDGSATLMNINVQSDDFDAPTITLFHLITDCNNLQNVGLTQSNLTCISGSNGEAEALGSNVSSNETYYIAVSSLYSVGGIFEICVNTISQASSCVASSNIQIVARSTGGPLTGPFLPGETVSICMNINSYTAAGNGCQWFQGMIPLFGNGWDPSSFDVNGQPIGATINGSDMAVPGNGLYGASTWDWFTGIGYHHNNVFFQVGDLDGNGTIEMCNILYDVDCPNLGGITGGCCGPCWANAGDPLPPGWFAYGINGTCPTPGPPPTVDWGDGNSCGGGMGPWHFCFDLKVRKYPDCIENTTTKDLKLGFFTTSDGETGSWTGGPSVCALDQSISLSLPMCCSELTEEVEQLDSICSGQSFEYIINRNGVDFWQWAVDTANVSGAHSGSGGPASILRDTLFNISNDIQQVRYIFQGYAGGPCLVFHLEIIINVYPKLNEELTSGQAIPGVVCPGYQNFEMSTSTLSNAQGYSWTLGWSGEIITSLASDNFIDIPVDVSPGIWDICVRAFNNCGTSNIPFCFPVEIVKLDDVYEGSILCSDQFPFQWNSINIIGPGTYIQTFENEFGCRYDSVWTVESESLPLVNFNYNIDDLLINFNNLSTNAVEYSWTFGDGVSSSEVNPNHLYSHSGNYLVELIGLSTCGSDTIDKQIELLALPHETILITPNGDNINDILIIDGIDKFPNNELFIVNRWGDIVYHAKPYMNDWGGEGPDGALLTQGTYYYILSHVGSQIPEGGDIVILK
ncbi:MAG: gliding motility-associated C-terminal domain-containing protein [Saprospiraceae bacterium]